ncbi:MAG: hypothetical protein J7K77_00180 [Dehalococcoidales bacterium]|nr:hypothetical protein [Dehalococcoidales bacterium]
MSNLVVYSFKVDREQLESAKKFLDQQGILLQASLRHFINVAAGCQQCLELHERKAPLSELQSAFITLLASCKPAWHLVNLLREVVMKLAKISQLPLDFIANVLDEAQRAKSVARRT